MFSASLSRLKNASIKKMFLICLLSFIICPLVLIALLMNQKMSQIISSQTHENRLEILKQSQKNISSVLSEIDRISVSLLSNDSLQEYCDSYINAKKSKEFSANFSLRQQQLKDHIIRFTNELAVSKSYIHSISITSDNESIIQYGGFVDPQDTRYFENAIAQKGKGYWTPVYLIDYGYESKFNVPVVSYIRCVNDLNAFRTLAIEKITMKEQALRAIYAVKNENLSEDDLLFIINDTGDIISADNKEILNTKISDYALMKDKMDADNGYFKISSKTGSKSVFYSNIENTPWNLIQVVSRKNMDLPMAMVNQIIAISILLCILFSILFTLIQNKYVIKPIVRLSKEMKKIEGGDFEVSLPVLSENETGMLTVQFLNMAKELKYLFETVYQAEIKEREAELMALQMQINPHFLYNTLDGIYWLAYKNKDYLVGKQIEALANMFRHTLNSGNELTTIGEELLHLQNYMQIQKIRLGERISLEINTQPEFEYCQTLKLILQPLVENAVIHGLEERKEGGIIQVFVERIGDNMRYTIVDNGLGADQQAIREILNSPQSDTGKCLALKNIHDRLRIKYGEEYGLQFYSAVSQGTRVEVLFPYT